MSDDERAIRELVDTWMAASKSGDVTKVLSLMAEDVVFMVPGQKPFGKEAFAAASMAQRKFRLEGTSDIQELKVLGDWAYLRNFISVTITPEDGSPPSRRSGFTLTILRKEAAGNWVLVRDANLMTVEATP
jgi:uncharacterized protein (TIGR02246 family)